MLCDAHERGGAAERGGQGRLVLIHALDILEPDDGRGHRPHLRLGHSAPNEPFVSAHRFDSRAQEGLVRRGKLELGSDGRDEHRRNGPRISTSGGGRRRGGGRFKRRWRERCGGGSGGSALCRTGTPPYASRHLLLCRGRRLLCGWSLGSVSGRGLLRELALGGGRGAPAGAPAGHLRRNEFSSAAPRRIPQLFRNRTVLRTVLVAFVFTHSFRGHVLGAIGHVLQATGHVLGAAGHVLGGIGNVLHATGHVLGAAGHVLGAIGQGKAIRGHLREVHPLRNILQDLPREVVP